jgi:hypothetical protein
MKKILILVVLLKTGNIAFSQHQEIPEKPLLWKGTERITKDTTSLLHAFIKGQVHGHFRYFFMATNNRPGLSDFYANAIGGGIKYETARIKGFQFGASGFFIFNIGSSDLTLPDPRTNQLSRYELGLFDIENPANKNDINRLEELYLKYSWKHSHITIGKQLINTAFINLQDGRMRPTEVGGLYGEINDIHNTKIEVGYFFEMSPRSTVKWYSVSESIGIYPQGVNPDGSRSNYGGNLESKGIFMVGISHKFKHGFHGEINNVFVNNIFNSLLLQAHYAFELNANNKILFGLQHIRQNAIHDGGNEDRSKTYFAKGGKSQSFGAKLGLEANNFEASINYTRITAQGRYLMPREWGRDPFFTFLPRERNEGLGDVHAYLMKAGYTFHELKLKVQSGMGYYDLPSVKNYRLNKYGMPSYYQINFDARYSFDGFFKGLETQFLFVYKAKGTNEAIDDRNIINRVDMRLWNLVFNYHF